MDTERADFDNQMVLVESLVCGLSGVTDCSSSRILLLESYNEPRSDGCIFRGAFYRHRYLVHIESRRSNGKWIWWMQTTDPAKSNKYIQEDMILTWMVLNVKNVKPVSNDSAMTQQFTTTCLN